MFQKTIQPLFAFVLVVVLTIAGLTFLDPLRSALVFAGIMLVSGGLLVRDVFRPRNEQYQCTGEQVTAIIPAYREAHTLHRSIESLLDTTYENLEIVVVCEPNDHDTRQTANEFTDQENVSLLINGQPGSKAGAINYAVQQSDDDLFLVADADEIVDPDFIPAALYHIKKEGREVFQGRRIPEPTGLVESLCYCDRMMVYSFWSLLARLRFKVPLSSSTLFTRTAFETVDGYEEVLTEDLDFAHKCYRHNISVAQCFNHANTMEAPHTFQDYWGQRKRWQMGGVQVLHRALTGKYDNSHSFRGVRSTIQALFGIVGQIFLLIIAAQIVFLFAVGATNLAIVPLAAGILTVIAVGIRDQKDEKIPVFYGKALLMPIAYAANGLISMNSLTAYMWPGKGGWYRVQKNGNKREYTDTGISHAPVSRLFVDRS